MTMQLAALEHKHTHTHNIYIIDNDYAISFTGVQTHTHIIYIYT